MTDVVPILKFKTGGESMQQIKSICHFINKYEKRNYYFLSLQLVGLELELELETWVIAASNVLF